MWVVMHFREDPEPLKQGNPEPAQPLGVVCWGSSTNADADAHTLVRSMPFTRVVRTQLVEFEFPIVAEPSYVYIAHSNSLGTATVGVGGVDGGFRYATHNVVLVEPDGKRSTYALLRSEHAIAGRDAMRVNLRFFDLPDP
jgi:hypothetical protein